MGRGTSLVASRPGTGKCARGLVDDHHAPAPWCGTHTPAQGEEPIPNLPAMYNLVTDFGARPDDNVADTAAFQAAFTRVPPGGVLFIPAGRFIVDK